VCPMSLHSGAYIRDLVGHVPSKMLSLRQDEVSVFNRMNIHGRRRISLPSKLSGITEKENSDSRDTLESLNKSYSKMKNKLDELEEYNQQLEKQLNTIFSSISASVQKVDRSGNIGRQNTGESCQVVMGEDSLECKPNKEIDSQNWLDLKSISIENPLKSTMKDEPWVNQTSELNQRCQEEQDILKNEERALQFSAVKNKINESNESHVYDIEN
jgi:hypothetical protein